MIVREVAVQGNAHNTRMLGRGQRLKLMSWNVQMLAGKECVFYYDLPDMSGPDSYPSEMACAKTLTKLTDIVRQENPDILLLQELWDVPRHNGLKNQLQQILARLGDLYPQHSYSYYIDRRFVPHPKIWGAMRQQLAILSRFPILSAREIPITSRGRVYSPKGLIQHIFGFKRVVLAAEISFGRDYTMTIATSHLACVLEGKSILKKELGEVDEYLCQLNLEKKKWIFGGVLNCLPTGVASTDFLESEGMAYYNGKAWHDFMANHDSSFPFHNPPDDMSQLYTHFPNNPAVPSPDKTVDYFFHSRNLLASNQEYRVRQRDTLDISDHLPVIWQFQPDLGDHSTT